MYNYIPSIWSFNMSTMFFFFVIFLFNVPDEYIMPLFLIYTLRYFNIISYTQIFMIGLILYIMYENKMLDKIYAILNKKYISVIENIHNNTGIIIADFKNNQQKYAHVYNFDKAV